MLCQCKCKRECKSFIARDFDGKKIRFAPSLCNAFVHSCIASHCVALRTIPYEYRCTIRYCIPNTDRAYCTILYCIVSYFFAVVLWFVTKGTTASVSFRLNESTPACVCVVCVCSNHIGRFACGTILYYTVLCLQTSSGSASTNHVAEKCASQHALLLGGNADDFLGGVRVDRTEFVESGETPVGRVQS